MIVTRNSFLVMATPSEYTIRPARYREKRAVSGVNERRIPIARRSNGTPASTPAAGMAGPENRYRFFLHAYPLPLPYLNTHLLNCRRVLNLTEWMTLARGSKSSLRPVSRIL